MVVTELVIYVFWVFIGIIGEDPWLSFRGRRSQGGVSLNSLDYGVFGPFKYEVNMFLSLLGPEVFS